MYRLHVQIKGVVQGVGFRPFVHSLATKFGLPGWVVNDSRGVELEVDGSMERIGQFLESLKNETPPLAQIVKIESEISDIRDDDVYGSFEIRASKEIGGERVLISPDVAVCADCLREMYDPRDPRYRYPFLNCTNCGPRFTIIEDLPYDREKTVMREFPMCEMCSGEYKNPGNRRFHAQPTCCPICGPKLKFLDENGIGRDKGDRRISPCMRRD
ncbi:MAG: acylphosphatase [bacterium]|nr:acylphosphatase [bacterium]